MQTPTSSRRTKHGCSVEALASTLVNSSVCYETDKKARRVRVQRLPTAYLLPISRPNGNSAPPFKRQLWTKYTRGRGSQLSRVPADVCPSEGRTGHRDCRHFRY